MTGPLGLIVVVAVVLFAGVADALPPKRVIGGTEAASGETPDMDSLSSTSSEVSKLTNYFTMTGLFGPLSDMVHFAEADDALPSNKIVGKTKAAPGEFPYMVSLRLSSYHFCGGVIVGPRHIVTTAHCLDGFKNDLYTSANLHVATGSVFSNNGTTYLFHQILLHPGYDSASSDSVHDIAIIVLLDDIAFDKNQDSIRLPTSLVPEDVLATVTEWEYPDWHEDAKSSFSELVKINVRTLRADSCNSSFAGTADIRESHICSLAGSGVGTCASPGGGALAYDGQLIGILSRRMACTKGYPDVYTNVFHYVDWIKEMMKE